MVKYVGPAPSDPKDVATKEYVDANKPPAGSVPVYIQATQPAVTGKYFWIQDLGAGNWTMWIEDGV